MSGIPTGGKRGYEASDVHVPPLVFGALVLALLIAVSMAVSAWVDRAYTEAAREGERISPLRELRAGPSGPQLQARPQEELAAKREWEAEQLSGTEWVDPLNGIIRIPIDRAIELTLKEGFPTRGKEEGR